MSEILTTLMKVWDLMLAILTLPLTVANKATEAANTVVPVIPLPATVGLLMALVTFTLWFNFLEAKGLSKIRNGIFATGAWVAFHIYVLLACQVLCDSGAIVTFGFVLITMVLCAPNTIPPAMNTMKKAMAFAKAKL